MVVSKKVEGEVEYNDGDFAEVQTFGIEGIEKNLLLATFQIHRDDTSETSEEFQLRFPVGTYLALVTTTEITKLESQDDPFGFGTDTDGRYRLQ